MVKDAGEPPNFEVEPPLEWYLGAGEYLEIPFSDYSDPEGAEVYMNVVMRETLMFAYFDYEENKIIFDKRMTDFGRHAGNYTITVELSEYL